MKRLIIVLGMALLYACTSYGEKLEFKKTEVYYTNKVSLKEVQKLGDYLVSSKFADGNRKSIQLTKSDNGNYVFRMVTTKEASEDKTYEVLFKVFSKELSDSVFDQAAVDFHVCNNTFKTLKVIPFKNETGE